MKRYLTNSNSEGFSYKMRRLKELEWFLLNKMKYNFPHYLVKGKYYRYVKLNHKKILGPHKRHFLMKPNAILSVLIKFKDSINLKRTFKMFLKKLILIFEFKLN